MEVIFLGVGEAFDENLPNNSQLIISDKTKILVDCGFTTPWQVWKYNSDPNLIDIIYISHRHGDHFFGLPALLLRMWEDGRKKDLTIICQKDLKDDFGSFIEFAYKGFQERFEYKINLVESADGKEIIFNGLKLFFQKTIHSGENLAVKIIDGNKSYAYSGDGSPLSGDDFYNDLDLLVLETYFYNVEKVGHSSIVSGIRFAEDNNVKTLALTHMNRDFRSKELPSIRNEIKSNKIKIIIPESLEKIYL